MRSVLGRLIFVGTFLSALLCVAAPFDRTHEFPNLFLPEKDWALAPEAIPKEDILAAKRDTNATIYSLLQRATMRVVLPGAAQPTSEPIFELLEKAVRAKASLRPLMRSMIGYIYKRLYAARSENPKNFQPSAELNKIASEKTLIPISEMWGSGSDFDILIHAGNGNHDLEKELGQKLTAILNSVRTHYNVEHSRDGAHRALFPLGDVKPYDPQIDLATSQGGSTVDFVSFDLKSKKLIEPQQFPGTLERLFRGYRGYADSKVAKTNDELQVTVVRSMRPETELPWLRMDPESEARYRRDLQQIQKIDAPKATEQFEKAVRNSRFSAGNNLFLRSPESSVQGKFAALLKDSDLKFPEFVENFFIPEGGRSLNGVPLDALMSSEDFFKNTFNGQLYHGTSKVAYLGVLRGNFQVSQTGQGSGAHGRGAYFSPNLDFSSGYTAKSEDGGIVIPIDVRKDRPIHVLDLRSQAGQKYYQAMLAKIPGQDVLVRKDELHRRLAADHGIDFIIVNDNEILALNSAAFEIPSPSRLVDAMLNQLRVTEDAPLKPRLLLLKQLWTLTDSVLLDDNAQKDLMLESKVKELARKEAARVLAPKDGIVHRECLVELAQYLFSEPYSADMNDLLAEALAKAGSDTYVYRTLEMFVFRRRSPQDLRDLLSHILPNNNQGVLRSLIGFVLPKAGSAAETQGFVKQIIGAADEETLQELAKYYFSQPDKIANRELFTEFVKKARYPYTLEMIAQYDLSRPGLTNMRELLVEIMKKGKSREVQFALARYVFSQPYARELDDLLRELVERSDSNTLYTLAQHINERIDEPGMKELLARIIQRSDPQTRSWIERNVLNGIDPKEYLLKKGEAPSSVAGKALDQIEEEVLKGTPDSKKLTGLVESLPYDLNAKDQARLQGLEKVFRSRRDPIRGYSYISKAFAKRQASGCVIRTLSSEL